MDVDVVDAAVVDADVVDANADVDAALCVICHEPMQARDVLRCSNETCSCRTHCICMLRWQALRTAVVLCIVCKQAFPPQTQLLLSLYARNTRSYVELDAVLPEGFPEPPGLYVVPEDGVELIRYHWDDEFSLMAAACLFWMACACTTLRDFAQVLSLLLFVAMATRTNPQRYHPDGDVAVEIFPGVVLVGYARMPTVCKVIFDVSVFSCLIWCAVKLCACISYLEHYVGIYTRQMTNK
jgi:hypothetical protein